MRRFVSPLLAGSLLLIAGCGGGGEPAEYHPQIEEAERRLGAEQHPVLLAEFGGAYQGPEAAYVARIGEGIAQAAELGGECTFTLVNTDVVNAFAVPGCYIYVTRGLMGLVNSEAELASVLAHELGHIVADHSSRQQNRSILRELGVIAVGLVTGSDRLTRLAGQAAQYFTLRYSRTQEYESDDLGIRYMKAAGYDPFEAADMLGALARQEQFLAGTGGENAKAIPEWARTHPLTENRIERARQTAAKTGVADNALPEKIGPFLDQVDGLLYGDDPEQGFVLGSRFAHPVMRISFEAPAGFTLTNSPQAILLAGPDGVRGEFGGGTLPPGGLGAYVEGLLGQMLGGSQAEVGAAEQRRINGLPALVVPVLVRTEQGDAQIVVAAYATGGDAVYHFIMVSSGSGGDAAIGRLIGSFRLLTPAEAQSLRPRQIRVVAAGAGDTVQSLARRMASDHPVDHFLMLNGRSADQPLRPGERVKIVTLAGS